MKNQSTEFNSKINDSTLLIIDKKNRDVDEVLPKNDDVFSADSIDSTLDKKSIDLASNNTFKSEVLKKQENEMKAISYSCQIDTIKDGPNSNSNFLNF